MKTKLMIQWAIYVIAMIAMVYVLRYMASHTGLHNDISFMAIFFGWMIGRDVNSISFRWFRITIAIGSVVFILAALINGLTQTGNNIVSFVPSFLASFYFFFLLHKTRSLFPRTKNPL